MSEYSLLIYIFIFELVFLFIFIIATIFHRFIFYFILRNIQKRKNTLSSYFVECIEKKQPFEEKNYPGRSFWQKELLEVLETFNGRFQGGDWETLKHAAAQIFLLPKARKWARSFSWTKRNFAARSFVLSPLLEDEKTILRLMDDKHFLVWNKAALAAIELESAEGIRKALIAMTREPGFSHFFYRDALLHCSQTAAKQMIKEGNDPAVHEACLDVLGAKSWILSIPFLPNDLQSKDANIRFLAICALIRNPLPDCTEILIGALSDPYEQIRIQAAKGLAIYSPLTHLDCLERALSDKSWFVRIETARALKQAGAKGMEILHRQKEAIAKEASQYVELFG